MEEKNNYVRQLLSWTTSAYDQYDAYFAWQENDSAWQKMGKVIGRIFALTLMILLSPVLLIGLFIAFIAVF